MELGMTQGSVRHESVTTESSKSRHWGWLGITSIAGGGGAGPWESQ